MDDNFFQEASPTSFDWGTTLDLGVGAPTFGDQLMLETRCDAIVQLNDPFNTSNFGFDSGFGGEG